MGGLQASGKSLLIGNFNYMGMRLDPTMTFLRDPYSRASYGEVRLHYYFRTDFEVLQAAAFQYATHPTA
jgi:HK97 family phage major capsid protein